MKSIVWHSFTLKANKCKIAMYLNLHFPDNSDLNLYWLLTSTPTCSQNETVFVSLRAVFLSAWPVTHTEEVRSVNVRWSFSLFHRENFLKDDISSIWSLHNIFPRGFSFLFVSRKNKNRTKSPKQTGNDSLHPNRKVELKNPAPIPFYF